MTLEVILTFYRHANYWYAYPIHLMPILGFFLGTLVKKQLKLKAELYTILQVLSLTLFEKIPLEQLLGNSHYMEHTRENAIQLNLFDNLTGH